MFNRVKSNWQQVKQKEEIHHYYTPQKSDFYTQFCGTTLNKNSCGNAGIKLSKTLPNTIKRVERIQEFKRRLHYFLTHSVARQEQFRAFLSCLYGSFSQNIRFPFKHLNPPFPRASVSHNLSTTLHAVLCSGLVRCATVRGGVRNTRGLGPTMTALGQSIGISIGMLPQTLIMSKLDQLSRLGLRVSF
jgi:hypothetical protein